MDMPETEKLEGQDELPQAEQAGKGAGFLITCINGITVLSGLGMGSLSYALAQGGWLSLLALFLVASVCWYTGLLLRRCMDVNPLIRTYFDMGEHAFGSKGRVIISVFLGVELCLFAVEILIFDGDNLNKLFPNMGFQVGGVKIEGTRAFVVLTSLVVLPTTWLKNLGWLGYVCAGGLLSSLILFVCLLWAGAVDGVGFHQSGALVNWRGMPTAISMFLFCYSGHPIFPTLYSSMKERNKFSKVLLVSFITTTLSYVGMAVTGYLMYGEQLKSQVTLNLPIKKTSSKIALYTTIINPITKYAIIIAPFASAIEEKLLFRDSRSLSILIRTSTVIGTAAVAIAIPYFGYLMAFIGSFLDVTTSIILPCLFYLKINKAARKFGLELVAIVVILVVASFISVVGTFTSVKQIVNHL